MGAIDSLRKTFYYFVELPIFSFKLARKRFESLEKIRKSCPQGPRSEFYRTSVAAVARTYPFLEGTDARRLEDLYTVISTIREADVFLYPFLNKTSVHFYNEFANLDVLSAAYARGPVLILYSHAGSYYESIAATGTLGFKTYPVANWVDPSQVERPGRWLYLMNMFLSERCFSGGQYLYIKRQQYLSTLKKIMKESEKSLIFSAIDLPLSADTFRKTEVKFLGGKSAFPHKLIDMFIARDFPVVIAFASVKIKDGKVKRLVTFEQVPAGLTGPEVVQLYASRLDSSIRNAPEQFLNLINLKELYIEEPPDSESPSR